MPLFVKKIEPDYCIGIWQITETADELLALLPDCEHYAQASLRFSAPTRRLEWLAVRALLFAMLGEEKEIAYHPSGKPYLADGSYSISISHTRGFATLLLGPASREVGIDIEQYGERVQRVAHKFIRSDEVLNPWRDSTTWSLLLHWSAKETLYKCLNNEGVDFIDHLRIFPFVITEGVEDVSAGSFEACEYKTGRQDRYTLHYLILPIFVLTYTIAPLPA